MKPLKPNHRRAKTAIFLIGIVLLCQILLTAGSLLTTPPIQTMDLGDGMLVETVTFSLSSLLINFFCILIGLSSGIAFIMWFRRAYFNLHQKVSYLAHAEGWAAGCWFVPIINLFLPYQIMKEIHVETKELFVREGMDAPGYSTKLIGWWWGLWLFGGVIPSLCSFFFNYNPFINVISLLITYIPLSLITMKIIRDYSRVEPLLCQIESSSSPVPMP